MLHLEDLDGGGERVAWQYAVAEVVPVPSALGSGVHATPRHGRHTAMRDRDANDHCTPQTSAAHNNDSHQLHTTPTRTSAAAATHRRRVPGALPLC